MAVVEQVGLLLVLVPGHHLLELVVQVLEQAVELLVQERMVLEVQQLVGV